MSAPVESGLQLHLLTQLLKLSIPCRLFAVQHVTSKHPYLYTNDAKFVSMPRMSKKIRIWGRVPALVGGLGTWESASAPSPKEARISCRRVDLAL
jgi:hypothetical protein